MVSVGPFFKETQLESPVLDPEVIRYIEDLAMFYVAQMAIDKRRRIAARLAEIRSRTKCDPWRDWFAAHGGDWINVADIEKELGRGES